MEIKSKKMPKTEKMQKMCILLGAIIIIIVLVFMPNGFISAINAIKMKQLSVWELMIMSFLSFVPMWIVIEDIVLGMISCQISYRLKENGIEILYKGKVRRAYKWDECIHTSQASGGRVEGQCVPFGVYCAQLWCDDRIWTVNRTGSYYVSCTNGSCLPGVYL